jgi:transposase
MHYIGIDMSKGSFHVAFDDTRVEKFENNDLGIRSFIKALFENDCNKEDTLIGTEATGVYHLLLCQKLREGNWQVKVINPLITHRMIDSTLRKIKTDKHDALAIRKTLQSGAGYIYSDTPEVLALKALVQERAALCRIKAETKQRVHVHRIREAASGLELRDNFAGVIKLLAYEMKELEREMDKFAPETQKLLRSIPGVGRVTSASLVAYVGDINRFSSAKKLVAYIGLDCRVYESGTSIHGKGYISKRGNRYLRHVLFCAAQIAKRRNPILKEYMDKKLKDGKHYFSALCAVERKLVHLIYAVWRSGAPFEVR